MASSVQVVVSPLAYRARELAAIEETLRQPWLRTNGQDLSEAHVWLANGF
jgi:hypothetical protein